MARICDLCGAFDPPWAIVMGSHHQYERPTLPNVEPNGRTGNRLRADICVSCGEVIIAQFKAAERGLNEKAAS